MKYNPQNNSDSNTSFLEYIRTVLLILGSVRFKRDHVCENMWRLGGTEPPSNVCDKTLLKQMK